MHVTSWEKLELEHMSAHIKRQMYNGEQATLARIFLARGASVPRHMHESEQYSLVISGALRLIFDDRDMVLRAGDICIIRSNEPHAAEALEDTWDIDFFAPRREDWVRKDDAYLRGGR